MRRGSRFREGSAGLGHPEDRPAADHVVVHLPDEPVDAVEPHLAARNGKWEIEVFDSDRYNAARDHRAPQGYRGD